MKKSTKRKYLVKLNAIMVFISLMAAYVYGYYGWLIKLVKPLESPFIRTLTDLLFLILAVLIIYWFFSKLWKTLLRRLRKYFRSKTAWNLEKFLFWIKICGLVILVNEAVLVLDWNYSIANFSQVFSSQKKNLVIPENNTPGSGLASIAISSNAYSKAGRYARTVRWAVPIRNTEKKYGIPEGLLAGLIMQESMGNPLQLNTGDDGGAGLMMFQPGTAQEYGLKTYGNSKKTGRDKIHGKALRFLVRQNDFDYQKLSQIDHRFHINKSIEAGGKFLHELHNRFGSWNAAVSAYNRGKPAPIPLNTRHVRMVKQFQKYYNSQI